MAIYTLEELINGNNEIVQYYSNARQIWLQIRESEQFQNIDSLAQELTNRQFEFEHQCGGRWLGQEIMAAVGIGQFYNSHVGFEATMEDVMKVKDAFMQSYCSLEVKWHAERIAGIFNLTENNEL